MAKKKSVSQQEENALKDFILESGISLSEAKLMLQELRNSAESRAIEADVEDFNKGGMVKSRTGSQDFRKGGMVLSATDNRKKKK